MGRGWIIACALSGLLAAAPAAQATTQSAHSGDVSATFSFTGKYPRYHLGRLKIVKGGRTFYTAAVSSKLCGKFCAPGVPTKGSSVHVVDLEHTGQPDVVLDLDSGGAHCCWIEQVFSLDPGTMTYARSERNFGDPGDRIVDLGHNGRYEFLTADDSFAYAFTDFAASGLPVQVLTFSGRSFHDVTRSYPQLIARNAAQWLKSFKAQAKRHYPDTTGLIAAWAADEDLLGHSAQAAKYLKAQAGAGHLNTPLSPQLPTGAKFVAKLQRFLRKLGYLT